MGTVHVTKSGKQCQKWTSSSPHVPSTAYTDDKFPDGSREAANNYCRNPDPYYSKGVWCYTTDPDMKWDTCYVPMCTTGIVCRRLRLYMSQPFEHN